MTAHLLAIATGLALLAPFDQSTPVSWDTLRESLRQAVRLARQGRQLPVFDLGAWAAAPEDLKVRARQLGSLFPTATAGSVGLSPFRMQLQSYFAAYSSRPLWRPLPGESSDDEFLLGDNLLIAPLVENGTRRQVDLPSGNWTSLETNQLISGPRTIAVDTPALPVFARGGSIVPLNTSAGIGLNYFPGDAAEFSIPEGDPATVSIVRASLAELLIESKMDRDYQWVIHSVPRPASIAGFRSVETLAELSDRTWFYEPQQKNVIVRVHVKANETSVIALR